MATKGHGFQGIGGLATKRRKKRKEGLRRIIPGSDSGEIEFISG
jgi:hypothetical protein